MTHKSNLRTCLRISMFFLAVAGFAQARTITVGPAAGYDFDTIQAGIDAATNGDTILVAPGEYVITEPITFRGKAVTVMSETGPDETTIRMGTSADPNRGSVVIFENGETAESILEGFTIIGGSGCLVPSEGSFYGGGIFFDASSATVRNCTIVQNRVDVKGRGGGVCCLYPCSPNLIDCTIAENIAELNGGGGVCASSGSSPSLSNCIIRDNLATGNVQGSGLGGGMCCRDNSSITITDCTIISNMARGAGSVLCGENSSVAMTYCVVVGNTADWGGGLATWQHASMAVTNCTIWGNSASISGGGMGCYHGGLLRQSQIASFGETERVRETSSL